MTKSHRRRWCSVAVCGNRMKVGLHSALESMLTDPQIRSRPCSISNGS
ncbi:CGNR zinc finger domain-containing protein [Burkholderia lata]|nr:CGNR zinc finger domain-containing protein [Burkholderia lata]